MSFFESLRNAHRLTRFVLVCWMLFMGVAMASPLVNPDGVQLVCTTTGSVKMVQVGADGDDASDKTFGLHCPLCLPSLAPPNRDQGATGPEGLTFALSALALAPLATRVGLPWQARAPPALF